MRSLDYLDPDRFEYLDKLANHLNNWGTTDWFSLDVMQPLLVRHPEETLALLRKWNASDHMWKQRSSVVTFARKAGASGRYTDTVLELCENLVDSEKDLIRKAAGWALKDNLRGNRKKVLSYIKDLRRRGVSSVVTLYAIRDIKGDERRSILAIKPPRRN
jgi:3-methyladenine DNA glycosylase AlkD